MHGAANTPYALTPTQVGRIAESLVSAGLTLASGGRLSCFVPLADDDGTDLVVVDKATDRLARIQIKSRRAPEATPGTTQFDLRTTTFRAVADNWLLCVLLDAGAGRIWRAWLIPATEVADVAPPKGGKHMLRPNPSPASRDRYAAFRMEHLAAVAAALMGDHALAA